MQDFKKCDRRQTDRQKTEDGVTDNTSTREACASKNHRIEKLKKQKFWNIPYRNCVSFTYKYSECQFNS